jgi:hypothetical protein
MGQGFVREVLSAHVSLLHSFPQFVARHELQLLAVRELLSMEEKI